MKRTNTQKSVFDYFAPKKSNLSVENDDEGSNSAIVDDRESDSSIMPIPATSNNNHKIHFDFRVERLECTNGNELFFDFILHLSDLGFNEIDFQLFCYRTEIGPAQKYQAYHSKGAHFIRCD